MNKSKRMPLFTLIELLVVIAIVFLLASLLLPALSKAKEAVHAISCASIERQLAQAYISYAGDYNGYSPVTSWNWQGNEAYLTLACAKGSNNGGASNYYWSKSAICPKATGALNDNFTKNGVTYYNVTRSYGYIYYMESSVFIPFRIDKLISSPSRTICFADGVSWNIERSNTDYSSCYAQTGETYSAGVTAYRHPGPTANIAFFDGHVDRPPWRYVFSNRWTLIPSPLN